MLCCHVYTGNCCIVCSLGIRCSYLLMVSAAVATTGRSPCVCCADYSMTASSLLLVFYTQYAIRYCNYHWVLDV